MKNEISHEALSRRIIALENENARLKQTEKALKESETCLQDIIDTTFDGIIIHDKGRIIHANEKAAQYLGYSMKELIGMDVFDFVAKEDRTNTENPDLEMSPAEVRLVRRDQSLLTVENYSRSTMYRGKEVRIFTFRDAYGMFSDVTEKKKTENALKESERRYRDLVENINDVVYALDRKGLITYISPVCEKVLGYKPDELLGRSPMDFIYEEDHEITQNGFQQVLSNVNEPSQYRVVHKSGELVWVQSYSKPIIENGRVMGIQGMVTDITEHKKGEEERHTLQMQLHQAQRMEAIGTLAGGIAHDFNNILAAVIGYGEMIQMSDLSDAASIGDRISEILRAAYRAKDLVHQILTFSRRSEQELKPLLLGPVIKETLKFLRASIPANIKIDQHIEKNINPVLGDPTQIHQILMNLCSNSAYAMRETGGILTVNVKEYHIEENTPQPFSDMDARDYISLQIKDTGEGIPDEIKNRIFDPFFTTKDRGEGTGMGLSVVYGIVNRYGGRIHIDSKPGEGACFYILLPSLKGTTVKAEAVISSQIPTGDGCILYVDDEEAIIDVGKTVLKNLGYDVVTRRSSIDALAEFKAQPDRFDLVITDLSMPNMTGMELSREMLAIRSDIPIVLCTGFSESDTLESARAVGIQDFLLKPFGVRDIAETVRKVLG